MDGEAHLPEIIQDDVKLNLVGPSIYSIYSRTENVGSYDRYGTIYDMVACNRLYNRIMWGYRTEAFHSMCSDALESVSEGWVLDAGCGSLAFSAKSYVGYGERPVVLLDQSMELLKMAKARLVALHGNLPPNVVFLHADALEPPFRPAAFTTIISMNLLHVLDDIGKFLVSIKNLTAPGGTAFFSTLVKSGRLSDRYLDMLGKAGAVVPRSVNQLLDVFDGAGMPAKCEVCGNMAFIRHP